jgi:hypothetical protein
MSISSRNSSGFTWQGLARKLAKRISYNDRKLLQQWAEALLDIRSSSAPMVEKIRLAARASVRFRSIFPTIKMIAKEAKRHGWDDRRLPTRLALSVMAFCILVFGGSGAGIAAFGTAIAVPLWIIFGAGAGFAGVLIDELKSTPAKGRDPQG